MSPRRAGAALGARLLATPASLALLGLVVASAVIRWFAAAGHHTLTLFQDEYLYSALAHGFATTHSVSVRGEDAVFPALLGPLLTAPVWLLEDPALALRLTQGIHAIVMSLSAIPVYLIARRVRLGTRLSIALAAFALAHPGLLYTSFWLAEPVALPLALTAFYVGMRALERPTPATQATFVAVAGLASFARIQFAILPVSFLLAALVVERGRVRRLVSRFRVTLLLLSIPLIVLALLEPARLLGAYWHFPGWYAPGPLADWTAKSLLVLAYSAGWALVPGAIAAVGLALLRPRNLAETAFGALFVPTAALLLFQVAAIASIGNERVEERYLLMLPPLIAIAFGLWWARGGQRLLVVALAVALLLVSARLPMAEYSAAAGAAGSPTLRALVALEGGIGQANASLVFAGVAALLSFVAALTVVRPQVRPVALASALVGVAALSVGAHLQDRSGADRTRTNLLAEDARWVDRFELGGVSLLQTQGAQPARSLSHFFWNRSLDQLFLLDDTPPIDSFPSHRVSVAQDGRLLAAGDTVLRPLLVDGEAMQIEFASATLLASNAGLALWLPQGTPRVSTIVAGRYANGWLADAGYVGLWPDETGRARGTLILSLSLPAGEQARALVLEAPEVSRTLEVLPGEERVIRIPVDAGAPWRMRFRAERWGFDDRLRPRSVRSEVVFRRADP